MSIPALVDDSNYRVQYHAGWTWDPDAPGYVDNTRHSSAVEGNTASLGFSGTGIQVFGTLEPSSTSGQPSTAYTIDNVWHGTYTAPYTAAENARFNVTFFSKLDLPPGNHQISIVNTNGTSPNTIWLDYFLVYSDPSPSSGPAPSSQSTVVTLPAAPDAPSVSSSITTSLPSITVLDPLSSTSVVDSTMITTNTTPLSSTGLSNASQTSQVLTSSQPTSPSSANTASQPTSPTSTSMLPSSSLQSASTSSSPTTSVAVAKLATNHVGTIVGTVLGAVVLVFLAMMLALTVRNRRHWSGDRISPFLSDRGLCTSTAALAETATLVHVREKVEEVSLSTSSAPVSPASSSSGLVTALSLPAAPHVPLHDGESTRMTDKEPLHAEVATAPWYTAAATQSRARAILQVFAIRGRGGRCVISERDVDSGLRRYDQPALPPPYTAE